MDGADKKYDVKITLSNIESIEFTPGTGNISLEANNLSAKHQGDLAAYGISSEKRTETESEASPKIPKRDSFPSLPIFVVGTLAMVGYAIHTLLNIAKEDNEHHKLIGRDYYRPT